MYLGCKQKFANRRNMLKHYRKCHVTPIGFNLGRKPNPVDPNIGSANVKVISTRAVGRPAKKRGKGK